jgi:hypothetical protein
MYVMMFVAQVGFVAATWRVRQAEGPAPIGAGPFVFPTARPNAGAAMLVPYSFLILPHVV